MTALPAPDRAQVRLLLMDLLSGRATREDAATWASRWVTEDDPDVDDPIVWNALRDLAGADLKVSPVDYLHSDTDIHEWLDRVETGDPPIGAT